VVITKPVRSQQQRTGTAVGNRMTPRAAGRAEEQSIDAVQPGKIAIRGGHFRGSHTRVAQGTGGIGVGFGRSLSIRMTWQTLQGRVREVSTAKHSQNYCIGRGSVQVPLSAEWEGLGILGRRASSMDLVCIHK
jgi:hypothetical protein